ncbi:hypothetical protein [Ralstonia phage RSL2]|uniref:Uncharacterized protein n=1 Tax=Ralstonia phage RSL2 TaxID=1585840 RepID=A0A0A8J9J8_9CAUD|nr:hypothetical protein [Ralstonia phage RSL2]
MGGSETVPPTLESVKVDTDGTIAHRRLGFKDVAIYPTQVQPGWLLEIEQLAIARGQMAKLLQDNVQEVQERSSDVEFVKALNETTAKVMTKLSMFSYFNANAMFQQTPIPQRLCYEGLQVLDYLVQLAIVQRDRVPCSTDIVDDSDYPIGLFSKIELDRVIGSIHLAEMNGLFLDPEKQAKYYGLIDEQFYCECAMAYSFMTQTPIPMSYRRDTGKYYQWAKKVLREQYDEIPNLKVRPKPQNVVNLFKTK